MTFYSFSSPNRSPAEPTKASKLPEAVFIVALSVAAALLDARNNVT